MLWKNIIEWNCDNESLTIEVCLHQCLLPINLEILSFGTNTHLQFMFTLHFTAESLL